MTWRRVQWIIFSFWALCASSKLPCQRAWRGTLRSLQNSSSWPPRTSTRWSFLTAPPWCAGVLKCRDRANSLENSLHVCFNRKTILGPRYGSPVERVLVLPMSEDTNTCYLAFITEDKVSAGLWVQNYLVFLQSGSSVFNLILISNDQKSVWSSQGWCLLCISSWGSRFCLWMGTPSSPTRWFATRQERLLSPVLTTAGLFSLQAALTVQSCHGSSI